MYWNKSKFKGNSNFKEFKVNFSDGDNLNGVIFKKEKNYFITSLSANIEIDKNVKDLKDFKKIKEVSERANEIEKKGTSHFIKDIVLEINLKDVDDLLPDKKKGNLAIKSLEFYDEKTQKNKTVSIYSQYEELKLYGLNFVKENGIIYKYKINLIRDERNNLFLEKKIFFDKNQIIEKIKKEYDYKNTFFIEHNGKLKLHTIGFTDFLAKYIDNRIDVDFMKIFRNRIGFPLYFFESLFGGGRLFPKRKRPKYIFTSGDSNALTDLHPIAVNFRNLSIKGGVNFYITPELYEKDHSIFKKIPEIQSKNVTTSELNYIRSELNDNDFTVSKIYGFRNIKSYSIYPTLNINNFIMPDFNVKITNKKGKEKIDENTKKIFEGTFYILDNKVNTSKETEIISKTKRTAKIKNTIPEKIKESLNEEYFKLKKLTEEINLNSFNRLYENFFLYDLENIIRPTYTTELQEEFSIYGLINFSGEINEEKKIKLIAPKNYLKFNIEREIYKNQLKIELNKVHKKKTFNIIDNNVFNLEYLLQKKKEKLVIKE